MKLDYASGSAAASGMPKGMAALPLSINIEVPSRTGTTARSTFKLEHVYGAKSGCSRLWPLALSSE
ncbi:MAG: hypothetical protein DME45_08725 [Verrucomicrobia bacterium]|nr:MAG: hypothetical protein DME45_08725 [Verrucomicrobiota bacterium]